MEQKYRTHVFWRIFRQASLNFLEMKQSFLRKFALLDKKSASESMHSDFCPKLLDRPGKGVGVSNQAKPSPMRHQPNPATFRGGGRLFCQNTV
jgi:hypothetical protein